MKTTTHKKWLRNIASSFAIVSSLLVSVLYSTQAQAIPSFARQTGAACTKCHSVSFPRLNATGERFMRNGFKLKTTGESLDGLGDDEGDKDVIKAKNLMLLKDVGDILSVRGKFDLFNKNESSAKSSTGSPDFFAVFAAAQLAPDVALWAEAETNTSNGETEVHNYMVNFTNLGSGNNKSLVNVRFGGFTPTEWTSWSDQKRVIDSASSHPGIYRGKHHFAKVGSGLGTKTGAEFYGYTDNFLFAAGFGEATGGNFHASKPDSNKDFWLVGRYDITNGSSLSVLYMDYGNDITSYTISGNYKVNQDIEFQAQYSKDDSGSVTGRSDVSGYGFQGIYTFNDEWLGILRYDSTDNGYAVNEQENQLSTGIVYAPWMNVKFTLAYVAELDRATTSLTGSTVTDDSITLQMQFAM